ncbi:MAG TPA: sn-glycerol-1-phosphate dehydrogenase [Gammaproteobacteria bacterium]|nr:sn-glycerol-1-phosphate dehydrogenase [Gammaproteobacteria bacterium]
MSEDSIRRLIDGTFPDPDGGPALTVPVRSVVIADTLEDEERDLVAALGLGGRLAVVSDPTTHRVLGQRVARALSGLAKIDEFMLPERPCADAKTVERIRRAGASFDALVAIGSGTINDLCKYAAALDGKPYVVFGTAPSMNGYTSVNAAITVDGHKKSLSARAPEGVFLDLSVLAAAPPRMIRSGLGDSLCRPTAQVDWLLANMLRGEPYRETPFTLLADDEAELFEAGAALLSSDLEAMRRLARTLVLSGFGMTICGGSMPASQGEHLIGHYAEMRADPSWPPSFHGEQIGVTTLTMARLQEAMLDGAAPRIVGGDPGKAAVLAHFGAEIGPACWREFEPKRVASSRIREINDRLSDNWERLRARADQCRRPAAYLEQVLVQAGAPVRSEDLGWTPGFYRDAVRHAREIRNRYTFLDLAAQSDRLESFVAAL